MSKPKAVDVDIAHYADLGSWTLHEAACLMSGLDARRLSVEEAYNHREHEQTYSDVNRLIESHRATGGFATTANAFVPRLFVEWAETLNSFRRPSYWEDLSDMLLGTSADKSPAPVSTLDEEFPPGILAAERNAIFQKDADHWSEAQHKETGKVPLVGDVAKHLHNLPKYQVLELDTLTIVRNIKKWRPSKGPA